MVQGSRPDAEALCVAPGVREDDSLVFGVILASSLTSSPRYRFAAAGAFPWQSARRPPGA